MNPMIDEGAESPMGRVPVLEEFLREHPQHVAGTRVAVVDGREEVMVDGEAMVAFSLWTVKKGHADRNRAMRYLAAMRDHFRANGWPWPEPKGGGK